MTTTVNLPTRHRGAGMNITPEFQVRQVLMERLYLLASDEVAIDELVSRVDDLRHGTGDQWRTDLKAALLDLLRPDSKNGLWIKIGYPLSEAELPCLSIINDGGGEDARGAVMGDVLGVAYELRGEKSFKHWVLGIDQSTHVQVGAWATAPELSLLLDAAVRQALFIGHGDLQASGVHEVAFTYAGMAQPSPDLLPRVGYVPITRVELRWTFRTTFREGPVPNSARVLTGTASTC